MTEGQEVKGIDVMSQILMALDSLPDDERERIVRAVIAYYGIEMGSERGTKSLRPRTGPQGELTSRVGFSEDLVISPKEFLLDKQPRTDVERIAALAFYLTHYRDTPYFKTIDLSRLNTEAAQPKFANATVTSTNAVKMGYLASASKGTRQLSAAGEQFVRALPDREAAKKLMDNIHRRKRNRKPSAKEQKDSTP
jgi:hypothetical protein